MYVITRTTGIEQHLSAVHICMSLQGQLESNSSCQQYIHVCMSLQGQLESNSSCQQYIHVCHYKDKWNQTAAVSSTYMYVITRTTGIKQQLSAVHTCMSLQGQLESDSSCQQYYMYVITRTTGIKQQLSAVLYVCHYKYNWNQTAAVSSTICMSLQVQLESDSSCQQYIQGQLESNSSCQQRIHTCTSLQGQLESNSSSQPR